MQGYPIRLADGTQVEVTVSIGVAQLAEGRGGVEALGRALLEQADAAVYRAKSAGRNRVAT